MAKRKKSLVGGGRELRELQTDLRDIATVSVECPG